MKLFVAGVALLLSFPIFGIITVGRKQGPKQSILQKEQAPIKKTVRQAIPNVHMTKQLAPPDCYKMRQAFVHKTTAQIFTEIYEANYWFGTQSLSGPDSSLDQTMVICTELPLLLESLQIETILDAGCGDFYWMQTVNLKSCRYIGIDIVAQMIGVNRQHFTDDNHLFLCLDMINDALPQVDLILCRDVLGHLTYKQVCDALRNMKKSGALFLLVSTHLACKNNQEKICGHHFPYNLSLPPFNLPKPLAFIEETTAEKSHECQQKALGLWFLHDLDLSCLQY